MSFGSTKSTKGAQRPSPSASLSSSASSMSVICDMFAPVSLSETVGIPASAFSASLPSRQGARFRMRIVFVGKIGTSSWCCCAASSALSAPRRHPRVCKENNVSESSKSENFLTQIIDRRKG